MQMIHGLTAVGAAVYHDAETLRTLFAAQPRRNAEKLSHPLRAFDIRELAQICDMLNRHDQQVRRRLRVRVYNRNNVFAAMHECSGYFACDNLAEHARRRHAHLFMKNVQDFVATLPAASLTLTVTRIGPSG